MDNIPAAVINYRREIIPAPTLDFEIGKIGLPQKIMLLSDSEGGKKRKENEKRGYRRIESILILF